MNPRTFFEKVAIMRDTQKEYFRTRSQEVLRKSKSLETEIDREIERVRSMGYTSPQPPEQPNLFSPTT